MAALNFQENGNESGATRWVLAVISGVVMWKFIAITISLAEPLANSSPFLSACHWVFPAMVVAAGFLPKKMRLWRLALFLAPVYYVATLVLFIWKMRQP
jgi:uncharacterized membrane protein